MKVVFSGRYPKTGRQDEHKHYFFLLIPQVMISSLSIIGIFMCSIAQSQRASRSGIIVLLPSGVSEYSALGGTWGMRLILSS